MANTCSSVITYQTQDDMNKEPFYSDREALAVQMFGQGKTATNPNWVEVGADLTVGKRLWVDHTAAQEFIDYVIANAPTYNITLVSTEIQDL
jgi:hypothetical protein